MCGGVKVLPLLGGFACKVCPASLQDFTIGGTLSASSLYPPSWNLPPGNFLKANSNDCYFKYN
jgi:hypothetical protein